MAQRRCLGSVGAWVQHASPSRSRCRARLFRVRDPVARAGSASVVVTRTRLLSACTTVNTRIRVMPVYYVLLLLCTHDH